MSVAYPANLARVVAGLLLLVVGVRLWVAGGLAIHSLGLVLRAGDYLWFVPWSPATAAACVGMVGVWVLVAPRPVTELTARWFPALTGERPMSAVPEEHREAARALPELAGAEWVDWDLEVVP